MSQLTDLDNNLGADEFSGFDSTSSRTSTGFTVISKPLTPIISPTITPQSISQPITQPRTPSTVQPSSQPRTPLVSTTPIVNLNNSPITETIVSTPRPNPYTTTPIPETQPEPVQEPTYDQPIFGGGGGGGAAQRTSGEEDMVETMPIVVEKKILGMKPKLFYSLLVLASIGGYFYFKSKSNIKSK